MNICISTINLRLREEKKVQTNILPLAQGQLVQSSSTSISVSGSVLLGQPLLHGESQLSSPLTNFQVTIQGKGSNQE